MALTVARAPAAARASALLDGLRGLGDLCLRAAASLLFSRSRRVGALVLAAAALSPRALALGLLGVAASAATARALRLAPDRLASGMLSYNALMVGLALAHAADDSPALVALVAVAGAASVLAAAALDLWLRVGHALPTLTLPFLATYYLAAGAIPATTPAPPHAAELLAGPLPEPAVAWLRALGAIVCQPSTDVGLVLAVAVALHSRIALALSVAGFVAARGVASAIVGDASPALAASAGLNGMLTAMALGSVWFIPSAWSYLLGAAGAVLSAGVAVGLAPRFERLGLPLLIVPFNAAVPLVLYVMRQRVADGFPHAVDFAPGTPEQNLAYFRSRSERFGAVAGVRLAAPFRGVWTCTQGVEGGITHQGPWRHALDFEVFDADGRAFRGIGAALDEFHCYKLPVLAPAAGVVARVVDGVPDNPVGEVNLDDNWGNVVVVYHAPGVYSCLAHLSPGTITVHEGQPVAAGEVIGRCGNSGRSATPHLHLQLQATAAVGDATIPLALHDAVSVLGTSSVLHAALVPARGEAVRRLDRDDDRAGALRFTYATTTRAHLPTRDATRHEDLVADLDLLGRHLLRSPATGAALYYEAGPGGFVVHNVVGDAGSALHLVRAALSRVPFDADDALVWRDLLPLRPFLPAWRRPLFDLTSPFGGDASLAMTYRARRTGDTVRVEGVSDRRTRDGAPWVLTSATLTARGGLASLSVTVRGRERRVVFERAPAAAPSASTIPFGGTHEQARV
ncbi:MAG: urea transporter [Polyangiales bacterium]